MRALFDDRPRLHHENEIGAFDGGKPVRHDEHPEVFTYWGNRAKYTKPIYLVLYYSDKSYELFKLDMEGLNMAEEEPEGPTTVFEMDLSSATTDTTYSDGAQIVEGLKAYVGASDDTNGYIQVIDESGTRLIQIYDNMAGQNSVSWEPSASNDATGIYTSTITFKSGATGTAQDVNINEVDGTHKFYFQTKFTGSKAKFYSGEGDGNKDFKNKLENGKYYTLVTVFNYNDNTIKSTLYEGEGTDTQLCTFDSSSTEADSGTLNWTDMATNIPLSKICLGKTANGNSDGSKIIDFMIKSFKVEHQKAE